MKRYKIIILFLFSIVGMDSLVTAAETIAVILKADGSVTVTRAGQNSVIKITRGYRLEDGDKIVTGEKSQAALRFIDDASLVRIRANSVCVLHGQRENNQIMKNIYIEAGAILSNITQKKGKFQIATPTSVASIKGTVIIGDHADNRGTLWYGVNGEAMVNNNVDSTSLEPGETVFVKAIDIKIEKWKTKAGEAPVFDGTAGESDDEFTIEFENDAGKKKTLQFKVKK
jgi:hypothetical protein